jgi:flagellar hook-associated protein 2
MAGGISFNGLGSGIDFSKLVDSVIAERTRPVTQLQNRSENLSRRSDALRELNGKLVALTAAAKALSDSELGAGREAINSDISVLTANASAEASTGSYKLNITRLASSLTQSSRNYSAASAAILAGGGAAATFELRKGGAATGTAITIDSGNNTLAGLRDAINNAKAGITATIIDTDGGGANFKLVLNSNDTGAAGRVELVETTSTGSLSDFGLTSHNITGGFTDLDAAFTINGLALTRPTNSFSDAVKGITFNLKNTGAAAVTISSTTTGVTAKLKGFINAYNDVQDFMLAQYAKDSSGRATGILVGEATLRSVQQTLREAIGASSANNGGTLNSLAQLGVSRSNDGKLTLDEAALKKALTDSFSEVKALLAGKTAADTGLAESIHDRYSKLSDNVTGVVQTAINGYQDSITRINKTVVEQFARISELRQSLSRQYAAVDTAINQLNSQGSALGNILGSLQSKPDK